MFVEQPIMPPSLEFFLLSSCARSWKHVSWKCLKHVVLGPVPSEDLNGFVVVVVNGDNAKSNMLLWECVSF